jgi:hypothetical protein
VDGGEVWDDWYRGGAFEKGGNVFTYASGMLAPFTGANRYYFNIHQLVFRATGPRAQLYISDWQSEFDPGGPVGQELMFNFVRVHPYPEPQPAQYDWEP